jgi:primase-polymerase (primpol)-like protein
LTGNVIGEGDASTVSDDLQWLTDSYFRPDPDVTPAEWNSGPIEHWRGPEDDNDLLDKAFKGKQAASIFGGGKCSFKQLFHGDEDAIAAAYPSTNDVDPYDRSQADGALCMSLAWWTGNDCERIQRLFEKSALVRKKWVDRPKYRKTTILGAVAKCKGCLGFDQGVKESNCHGFDTSPTDAECPWNASSDINEYRPHSATTRSIKRISYCHVQ